MLKSSVTFSDFHQYYVCSQGDLLKDGLGSIEADLYQYLKLVMFCANKSVYYEFFYQIILKNIKSKSVFPPQQL